MNKLQGTLLGLAITMAAFGPGPAFAERKLQPEELMRLPPAQQKAYVQAQIAKQQQRAAQPGPSLALDTTPPVLTAFNAGTLLNLASPQPTFNVAIKGADDLSGIIYAGFQAKSPSGNYISGSLNLGYPSRALNGKAGLRESYFASRLLEPGTWTIDYAYVQDLAGNYSNYDAAQLAALGNTVFTVASKAYDLTPPVLVSGRVLTPSVSLSSFARGTSDVPPFIGVSVKATDEGNTGRAGVDYAFVEFCLADGSHCIYAYGETEVGGLAAATLSLGRPVSPAYDDVPGDYFIDYAYVVDKAGNYQVLYGPRYGGTTDFSTLFPTTKITLTP